MYVVATIQMRQEVSCTVFRKMAWEGASTYGHCPVEPSSGSGGFRRWISADQGGER